MSAVIVEPTSEEVETGDALDLVALSARVNRDHRYAGLTPAKLGAWLDSSGLAERGEDGRLRLTREAWAMVGRAFG